MRPPTFCLPFSSMTSGCSILATENAFYSRYQLGSPMYLAITPSRAQKPDSADSSHLWREFNKEETLTISSGLMTPNWISRICLIGAEEYGKVSVILLKFFLYLLFFQQSFQQIRLFLVDLIVRVHLTAARRTLCKTCVRASWNANPVTRKAKSSLAGSNTVQIQTTQRV
jgi:hypothetical protein